MIHSVELHPLDVSRRRFRHGALLLGVALSGFFDGVLLHQVLQWHHLLSGVNDPLLATVERQVLADGLFHLLMYGVAAVALWLLWQGRATLGQPFANALPAYALAGFGLWNVFDVAVFHWVFGLHRVRMDSTQPLAWDSAWLLAFGFAPLVLSFVVFARCTRQAPNAAPSSSPSRSGLIAWAALSAAVVALGVWSARPPAGSSTLLVLYPVGTTGATVVQGAGRTGARILWVSAGGTLWAFDVPPEADTSHLYRHGALLTSRITALSACSQWLRPGGAPL
jgi:uncharacterized membrane protein